VLDAHDCQSESMRLGGAATFLIRFPMQVLDARHFVAFFAAKEIEVGRWFSSPVSSGGSSQTDYGYVLGSCPVAETVSHHMVNLPLNGRLTKVQIDLIAATLDDYLRAFPEEVEFIQDNPVFKPLVTYRS
jgi:dTDP-4-amino-4,6-dideoxygalactose transaminase